MCNKKYKLIQEYPGGPKEGSIFEFGDWGLTGLCYQHITKEKDIFRLDSSTVENSSKFFKLISDPEYVKCIKKDSGIEVGKIYKVRSLKKNYNHVGDIYYLEGTEYRSAPYYTSYFVESSKEEFDKQNQQPKFEILSYYAKNISGKGDDYVDPTYIWKEKSPGKWARFCDGSFVTTPFTQTELNNHKGYGIHSVKRLSDGEVFTIGDKCNIEIVNGYRNPIIKIELTKNGTSGHLEQYRNKETIKITLETNSGKSWGPFEFDCIQKSKIPLLTTEDGVEIFKGGEFWEVFSNYSNIAKVNSDCIETFLFNSSTRKAFSTKEKAQEFVENNKKKYSLNDIEKSLGILDKHLGNPLLGDVKRHILYHISNNI